MVTLLNGTSLHLMVLLLLLITFSPPGKVLFYCHYPDLLLTTRKTFLKKIYRGVLDAIEEWSTSCAHKVLVNSAFTAGVFKQTFKSIKDPPAVLYPSLNTENFLKCPERNMDDLGISMAENGNLFVSVNRFERKKNLGLALHALRQFLDTQDSDSEISTPSPKDSTPTTPSPKGSTHLVIAGGYDPQNRENIEHYEELVRLSSSLNLDEHVTFLKSPDEVTKVNLLRRATCLIYTPDAEHFGIVPIESMFCGTPVIGVNSGGPTETVVHGVTGYLCPNTPEGFAAAMREVVPRSREMGEAGKRRVRERFSFERFSQDLTDIISELAAT
ncbi:hypothetical protein HAZT_HAZT007230 [Hyalella azteca]|uniref:Alpha-1,3/1,6-mannosyltransferase ALG2 n=1 Tax=Hyalella azteca TaxID=294128 RepID=A0A6A0HDD4_HYAAZ|nr:hypothetical protein HAZT_HAZT007230 [Hyalella azteca]